MDNLIIIFTIFDQSTIEYLHYFEETSNKQLAKAISYPNYYRNLSSINDAYKNIHIVLISEGHFNNSSDKSILREIIAEKQKIFLTLHRGGHNKVQLEREIQKMAGAKLQLPIREEIHTKGGPAFEMLIRIGRNHVKGNPANHQAILNTYLKNSGFDLSLEAKFEILHLANELEDLKDIFTDTNPQSAIEKKMVELTQLPPVNQAIRHILANPNLIYVARIQLLQEVLFVEAPVVQILEF